MKHLSELTHSLEVVAIQGKISDITPDGVGVQLLILPFYSVEQNCAILEEITLDLNRFIEISTKDSVTAILTSPIYAAQYCSQLEDINLLKLWVPIKLEKPLQSEDYIDQQHAALLFFSKGPKSLDHTITRIAYTYCPACDKTTKDYGGKKHLYHEFGTLIPDVWRDITVDFYAFPEDLIERLQGLFGIEKHDYLRVYDQRIFYPENSRIPRQFKIFDSSPAVVLESELIQGDCLLNLKTVPSNSIDFVFADPPYNVKKKYNNWNDSIDIRQYFDWCDEWLTELARVLKPGCTLAVLNIPKWCIRHFKHLNNILDYQDWIVWEGRSLPSKNIVPIHYSILCFSKGRPRPLPGKARIKSSNEESIALQTLKEGFCIRETCLKARRKDGVDDREIASNIWWDIHRLMHNSRRVDHPCQLPPNFMYRLISLFTESNEVILDPFNGAGTTSLCAEMMHRRYIGLELSEYYHQIAKSRHAELKDGKDPFRKNASSTPKVKNSRYERIDKANYKVTKKDLQLEIKAIANQLGKTPSKEEVYALSKYPSEYFTTHFLNWGEALAAVRTTGMNETRKIEIASTASQLKLL